MALRSRFRGQASCILLARKTHSYRANKSPMWSRRGRLIRFGYDVTEVGDESICLWLPDSSSAEKLVAIASKTRTKEFRPQIKKNRFRLCGPADRTIAAGAGYHRACCNQHVGIHCHTACRRRMAHSSRQDANAWGSNFESYTTDGEWWRLFTSLFIHFGIAHLASNMIALAVFGPLVERLYGSVNYFLIYLLAGSSERPSRHRLASEDINTAGASGAIFGILGALCSRRN